MQKILQEFGFKTILSHGGYFMIADASNIGCFLNDLYKIFNTMVLTLCTVFYL